jgi:hypothetical protein
LLKALKPIKLKLSSSSSIAIHSAGLVTFPFYLVLYLFIYLLVHIYKCVHYFNRSDSFTLFHYITGAIKYVKKAYDALLLDAGGTLLQWTKPFEETYASIGRKYVFFSFLFMLLLLLFTFGIICYFWIRMK